MNSHIFVKSLWVMFQLPQMRVHLSSIIYKIQESSSCEKYILALKVRVLKNHTFKVFTIYRVLKTEI